MAIAITLAMASLAHGDNVQSLVTDVDAIRLGFAGAFKLGCWTELRVTIHNGVERFDQVQAIVPDADGVPVTYSTAIGPDVRKSSTDVRIFVRCGQDGASIAVHLVDRDGRRVASRSFLPGRSGTSNKFSAGLPATNRLIVTLGAREDLAAPLTRGDQQGGAADALHTVQLEGAADLPVAWYGYESVDAVILSGSDSTRFNLPRDVLAPRIAALAAWVELGGRVVIFCGAETPDLIAPDGPLAPLVPGRYDGELVPLQDFTPLEIFSGASVSVTRANAARFRVPRLIDVEGRLLAQGPGELPLVVRARRGLGEVTFVAADPEAPPLNSWSERDGLIRQALQWTASASGARRTSSIAAADLSNQLRSALDQQFTGVAATPFAWVAGLVLVYVALIGPADYYLLRRTGRMQLTWLTFPVVVIAASAGAYALAYREKGRELRVNQVEIVDVDVAARTARGTVITHFFNPRIQRFNLALAPRFANAPLRASSEQSEPGRLAPGVNPQSSIPNSQPQTLAAWLGVPGYGLGAMQGQHGQLAPFDRGYRIALNPATIEALPVEQWSTKSLIARWSGPVANTIDAELHPVGDDLLAGHIANRTGVALDDCVLLHGHWAYQLPPLAAGAEAKIDDSLPNATIKTTLTSIAAGDDPRVRQAEDGSVPFDPLSIDVARIAKLMMFYDAVGGAAYAGTPNRYLSYLDLSRLVHGDQAILLARAPDTAGSLWTNGDHSLASDQALDRDRDRGWTYYRFVIALTPQEESGTETQGPSFGPTLTPAPQTQ